MPRAEPYLWIPRSYLFVRVDAWSEIYFVFNVGYRRRNHICAARPFAEINQPAAVTAKREVFVVLGDRFLAGGATQFERALAWHRKLLDDPGYQIIVVGFSNLTAIKFTDLGLTILREVIHKDFAINFRSMHLRSAFVKQIAFFGCSL